MQKINQKHDKSHSIYQTIVVGLCYKYIKYMEKLLFNKTAIPKDKQKVTGLSLEEEKEVINILNKSLNFFDENQIEKVQKLIYYYENLCHFAATRSDDWLEYYKPFKN